MTAPKPRTGAPETGTPKTGERDGDLRRPLMRGAGVAVLGRMGALVEAASLPLFVWAYGATAYGLFAAGWALVKVASALSERGMAIALQRYAAGAEPAAARAAVGLALRTSLATATALAALLSLTAVWWAPVLAGPGAAAGAGAAGMSGSVSAGVSEVWALGLYVWVLPLWTLLEVATAAVRATARFGAEVRVRIAYEQGLRLVFGLGLAGAGLGAAGLFLAHGASLLIAGLLALRLVRRSYGAPVAALWACDRATAPAGLDRFARAMIAVPVMRRLMSEAPVMLLSALAGPAAAAVYAVARKVASVMQVLRAAVDYAMAPLLAGSARRDASGAGARDLADFARRVVVIVGPPLAAGLLVVRGDVLRLFEPHFAAAALPIAVLVAGRLVEALCTPATVVVEMTRGHWLSTLNTAAGLALLLAGTPALMILAPGLGATLAAAMAAAAGLALAGGLAAVQAGLAAPGAGDRPQPGTAGTAGILRALAGGVVAAAVVAAVSGPTADLAPFAGLGAAIPALVLAVWLGLRLGLTADDRRALRRR
ncbi:O-antigen/teichoic acid export membrane protein [Rhodothalassium salexigens DSM 2132]|uniref:O-antigen/teichoic acid export membrane protein n=1 Tax=Rhodothalassium salexigens DSM 2132 TaxID=1188247 RepID=A0A4V2SQ95_RHOSA|nr:hypothetical protein [Rhodothalassium salexigens]MBB4210658.1 O-antigen/teichoic acid export membrane protein [Rhodothalassium salexigens DSM 2132]TCP37786.1 O-antigen/teichoic acid export membrane protein [Rhodothalassium salexigens DSM 2132]